jgi:hypothetical protein
VAFAPDGKILTSGGHAGYGWGIRVWDKVTAREVGVLGPDVLAGSAALSRDGKTAAVGTGTDMFRIWDLPAGKEKMRFRIETRSDLCPAFSPDGKLLAAGTSLWDVATGKRVRKMQAPCLGPFTFSPDGKMVASVRDGIALWDTATGRSLPSFDHQRHDSSPHGEPCFSADGSLVAVPDFRDCFTVWEVPTRRFVGRCASKGEASSVTFSPDGRLLACGKEDGSVELWEVLTWTVGSRQETKSGIVYGLAFSADNKTLVSGHQDTTVLLWDVRGLWAPARRTLPPTTPQLHALWTQLGSEKAAEALAAVGALIQAPKQSVALLHKQVQPTPSVAKPLAKWLADLDSDDFAVREKASAEIGRLGRLAAPALREALKGRPSLEVRRRAQQALERIDQRKRTREELRDLRAVLVLEQIGSAEARALLRRLAAGTTEASLTQEAKAALRRLER